MKQLHKALAFLLCLGMVFAAFGCAAQPPAETTAATTEDMRSGLAVYEAAIAPIAESKAMTLQITTEETVAVGNATVQNRIEQTVSLADDLGKLTAGVSEKAVYGNHTAEFEEIFAGGKLYLTTAEQQYTASMTAAEFSSRYAPAIALDADLYSCIKASADEMEISFSQPAAPEAWAAPEGAQLLQASGTAKRDAQGALESSIYEITYRLEAAVVTKKVTVQICPPSETPVSAPAVTTGYQKVDDPDALRLLERSYGYLITAECVSSTMHKSIISQAVGVIRSQQYTVDTYGSGEDQMVATKQMISQVNYSTGGESTVEVLEETFRDGKYTSVANGGEPEEDPQITLEAMQNHYRNMLVENILDPGYIAGAACEDLGEQTLITFTPDGSLGDALCAEVNYALFQDEQFLNALSSDYATTSTEVYLAIDNASGLPTAAGISYSGTHTISSIQYNLSMQVDQSFDLASKSAYEAITGESAPADTMLTAITPLFYKVTGPQGETMWLLGTIHVGDERIAGLPQQIVDAFDSSDALAVEFDTLAYLEQLETDPALQQQVADAYYFAGTTAADHIADAQLYEKALQLMKATGNYNYNTAYLKPSLWAEFLQTFCIRQGYRLTADYGVDTRLLKLAKQQDMPILEIESGLDQIRMNTGWTDALQECLLADAVATAGHDYRAQLDQLYDLWCAGNEEQLRQLLQETPALTEAEEALYEEYTTAMSTNRNALMLEKAKTYLESGDTVFYAVGLAHLLCEDGLVKTLQDAGFTVTAVTYE